MLTSFECCPSLQQLCLSLQLQGVRESVKLAVLSVCGCSLELEIKWSEDSVGPGPKSTRGLLELVRWNKVEFDMSERRPCADSPLRLLPLEFVEFDEGFIICREVFSLSVIGHNLL